MVWTRIGSLAAVVSVNVACCVGFGLAQTATPPAPPPKPAASPVSAEPENTTATYGDWVLHCQRAEMAGQIQRVCEVEQTLQAKGQGVVAEIAFGRRSAQEPLRLTIVLPPNIALPGAVRFAIDEKDEGAAELSWKRCLPGGCVADTEIRDEMLRVWRAQSGSGQIRYVIGSGQKVNVVFSFRGLAIALDNLAKIGAAQ